MEYDTSGAKVLRRTDTKGIPEDMDMVKARYGVGVSWDAGKVDIDLQCVVVDVGGAIVDCAYYNNMKAGRGITHSGDAVVGKPSGIQELIWVTLPKLSQQTALLIFVVAAYSGGSLRDVVGGRLRILEDSEKKEIANFDLEHSAASVDVVCAMFRGPDGVWRLRIIDEPAQKGQHFMDIMPLLSETIRAFLPEAPRRQKVAFAMEKGGVMDLPQDMGKITVGLGWDQSGAETDLDVSAILLDSSGKDIDAVFFGRLECEEHGIYHAGDNFTGEGEGDDEQIRLHLDRIGPAVQQVFFLVNIYSPGMSFSNVVNPYCRVIDGSNDTELCRYALREAGNLNGLLIARIAREPGDRWGFHALGLPCKGRTFKDSLPDVHKASSLKTASLVLRKGSTADLGSHSMSKTHTGSTGLTAGSVDPPGYARIVEPSASKATLLSVPSCCGGLSPCAPVSQPLQKQQKTCLLQ